MSGTVLVDVAVAPEGRRAPGLPVLDDDCVDDLARYRDVTGNEVVVVLDHAGPRAALWSSARPLGPSDVPEPDTGRRPLPLDDAGWEQLADAYIAAAHRCRRVGLEVALGVDDDSILHASLSPRTAVERASAPAFDIHRALGNVPVTLVVEELCPGGLDATDGIANARAFVAQLAPLIYASGGSAALPALRYREKGTTPAPPAPGLSPRAASGATSPATSPATSLATSPATSPAPGLAPGPGPGLLALASPRWLLGRVDVPVIAIVPCGTPAELAVHAEGFAGVIVEDASE